VRCEHEAGGGVGPDRGAASAAAPRTDRAIGNGHDTDRDATRRPSSAGPAPGPPVPPNQANQADQASRPNAPNQPDSRSRPGSPSRSDPSSRREPADAGGRTPPGHVRPSTRPPRDDEPPLPPEPPPYDDEPYEEEIAPNPADDGLGARSARRDPSEVAIELLSAQLGARAVEDRGPA
jgi:DNA polymerase-3 subunit gamma/tau